MVLGAGSRGNDEGRRNREAQHAEAVRAWAEGLGQETFVGSSGRVFPRAMKASPLLRAWLARLQGQGVRLDLRHQWEGWNVDGRLRIRGAAAEEGGGEGDGH